MPAVPLTQIGVQLRPTDNIAVAAKALAAAMEILFEGATIKLPGPIKMGHKFAVHPIREGEPITKYGQIIGFASRDIPIGDHVHVHNVKLGSFERDYAFCRDTPAPKRRLLKNEPSWGTIAARIGLIICATERGITSRSSAR